MKKRHLIISAMVCCAVMGTPGTAMSQMSETATKEVYDFSGFVDVDLLDLFYNALQEGRNYPTEEEVFFLLILHLFVHMFVRLRFWIVQTD